MYFAFKNVPKVIICMIFVLKTTITLVNFFLTVEQQKVMKRVLILLYILAMLQQQSWGKKMFF